jgi:hypothetical protein
MPMEPSTKAQLEFWRDVIFIVCAMAALWVDIRHAEHLGTDVSMVTLTLFCLVVAGVLIWVAYRNLRDAHRAESLRAQIVSIREDHAAQLTHQQKQGQEELRRQAKQADEQLDREVQLKEAAIRGLKESEKYCTDLNWKIQQWEQASVIYSLAGNIERLLTRFEHMRSVAQDGSTFKELLEHPLSNPLPTTVFVDQEDLSVRACIWRFQQDLRDHKDRLQIYPDNFKQKMSVLSMPSEIKAETVVATLRTHHQMLKDYAASLFEPQTASIALDGKSQSQF